MKKLLMALIPAGLLAASLAMAAEPVKIGMVTTLSTKAGYLGEEIRDGFKLAIAQENGTLGGVPVELIVEDDEAKPEKGKQLAGKGCHPNYFSVAYQNDNPDEVVGQYVTEAGHKTTYLLAPNYPAGKDHLAGFKRYYKGQIAAEVYTKLDQSDYAAEIAAIRAAKPEAVYFFLPGGMGINFVKQYSQAGLIGTIPLYGPAFSFDERILKAVGAAALGVKNGSHWAHDLDNPANKQFVAAYRQAYGNTPTLYASQGYDTARLLASALKAVGGDLTRIDEFRAALKKAEFESTRGNFAFGNNQHPIHDMYIREVIKTPSGDYTNKTVKKVFTNHVDAFAGECAM